MKKFLFLIAVMTFVAIGKSEAIYYLPQKAPSTPSAIATQYQVSYPIRNLPASDTGKNQLVAALLAYFLGAFGVHNFYLGYRKKGMQELRLTVGGLALSAIGGIFIFLVPLMATSTGGGGAIFFTILGLIIFIAGTIMTTIGAVMGFVDFIRIVIGDLKPAGGDYEKGRF